MARRVVDQLHQHDSTTDLPSVSDDGMADRELSASSASRTSSSKPRETALDSTSRGHHGDEESGRHHRRHHHHHHRHSKHRSHESGRHHGSHGFRDADTRDDTRTIEARHPTRERDGKHARHDSRDTDAKHDSRAIEARHPTRDRDGKHASQGSSTTSVPGLFVIDTKGDPLIRKYGPDRSKVPPYYRYGRGKVLGTNGKLVVDRDGPVDKFSLAFLGDASSAPSRQRDGLRTKGWWKTKTVRLRAVKRAVDDEPGDYIAVEKPRKRTRVTDGESSASDADEQPSWKSIQVKAKPAEDESSGLDSDASDVVAAAYGDDSLKHGENPLKWKSIQLRRRVKDVPGDIDAWLELVDHQDALLRQDMTGDAQDTERATHSYTEIKVDMLESALKHASQPADRQLILVALMRNGVRIWTREKAAKQWLAVADDECDNFLLWKTHLDYVMSGMSTFRYIDIVEMMVERLVLVVARNQLASSDDAQEAIYVFLRATRFLHDAGRRERAVAAWQGLLEMHFFPPNVTGYRDTETSLRGSFIDFWDSEVPRIGEVDSQGWWHFNEHQDEVPEPLPSVDVAQDDATAEITCAAWVALQWRRAQRTKMPVRPMDEASDDDLGRLVPHDDISPFLFRSQACVLRQLVDAFIIFCRISPPVFGDSEWIEDAYQDPFLSSVNICPDAKPHTNIYYSDDAQPYADICLATQSRETCPASTQSREKCPATQTTAEQQQRKQPNFSSTNMNARPCPSLLFSGRQWFGCVDTASQDHVIDMEWVETTLKQLVHHKADMPELAVFYLGLCFEREPARVRKVAKAVLGRYAGDARVYAAYACAQLASGEVTGAEKVVMAAAQSESLASSPHGPILFSTWAWLELERGNKVAAAKRLCAAADASMRQTGEKKMDEEEEPLSPALLLKARQFFSSNASLHLYQDQQDEACINIECLILLAYLADTGGSEPASAAQGNISAALDVVESMVGAMQSHLQCYELVLQCAARLLYFNATRGVYIREHLSRFIDAFPHNTIFLRLFDWADTGLGVIDETQQLLQDKVLIKRETVVTSHAFAIEHALRRGRVEAARGAFEQAAMGEAAVCASLWTSYVHFSRAHLADGAARRVALRAWKHCPWDWHVALDAVAVLGDGEADDEGRGVYRAMKGMGVRIYGDWK